MRTDTEDLPDAVSTGAKASRIEIAAAVNDHQVLDYCLRRSPDVIDGAGALAIYEGYGCAGDAYNAALDAAKSEYLMLVHQDVYLPKGTLANLEQMLDRLSEADPNWAVVGVIGMTAGGETVGQTWSTSQGGLVGFPVDRPVQVETLDEMLLVVRTAKGLRFDPHLPLFHLYAADIIQIARQAGLTSYVIPLMAVHFERRVVKLGEDYRRAYRYFQKKWRDRLPLPNLICPVVDHPWRLIWKDLKLRKANGFARDRPPPKGDPVEIARSLEAAR
jgi:hypothetical protein